MSAILKITDLRADYGGIHALRGVSMEIEQGEIVSVLGANGAGKSTLLKCISSVMKIAGGSIEFEGKPVSKNPTRMWKRVLYRFPRQGRFLLS